MLNSRRSLPILLAPLLLLAVLAACREQPQTVTLYAVGDVMLGRHIATVMQRQGADRPFRNIGPVLRQADIVLGNFEAPISAVTATLFFPEKPYSFHASPPAAQAVAGASFHLLSLANNHALDYGPDALFLTQDLLAAQGVAAFGAGKDLAEARRPVIVTRKGIRFGFLGYGIGHSTRMYALKARPGISPVVMENIRADMEALRRQVDIVVLSLHWGTEYQSVPSARQRAEAHQMIDWGADLIVGHHPHVMQGIEVYKGRIIAYSLGNFIFDQKAEGTDRSYILAATFSKHGPVGGGIIPLDRKDRYFPAVAGGPARAGIMAEVKRISGPLNDAKDPMRLVGMEQ